MLLSRIWRKSSIDQIVVYAYCDRTEIAAVFGLGLFHGLGFAIAMSAQLNNARFPIASVIGFNLGIEMGQLAICLILGAVFWFLRRYPSLFDNLRSLMIWSGFIAGGF